MRVIGEEGEQLDVMPLSQAIQLAIDKDLDLVEVAPTADPPVCRLMDYGKFKYEQAKKEREAKKGQRASVLREVRMRPRIGAHDILFKTKLAQKLLDGGDKVKVSVLFRGREVTHPEIGINLLGKVAGSLKDEARLERAPVLVGRIMSIILIPAKHAKKTQVMEKTSSAQIENP